MPKSSFSTARLPYLLAILLSTALLASIVNATPASAVPGPADQVPASTVAAAPATVLQNWEKLIGTWVADNSAFKNENDTIDAYGIEWSWGLGKQSLIGRLYGIRDGKEIATFWEFREFWHPGDGTVFATQFGVDGTYGVGPHTIRPDGTSEMVQTFYNPSAKTISKVGHRSTLEGDVHTTASFDVDDTGRWTPRRTYVWHRR